ncbi:TRAP transporter small permease [Acuticoccus sediminis]|nr:TRAP transporter small permease [Acuticoccus sediminis]
MSGAAADEPGMAVEAGGTLALRPIRIALAALSAVLLMALMGITVVDVAGRYLFNSPVFGATELTELVLAAVIFSGLPAVCLDDGHVTVRLFTARLGPRGKAVELAIARLITAAALGVIAWRLAIQGMRTASYGEVTTYLRLPVGPIAYTAAALCTVSALLTLTLVAMRAGRGGTATSV